MITPPIDRRPSVQWALRIGTVGLIGILSLTSGTGEAPQSPGAGAFAAVGAQSTRDYFSQMPFDRVDLINGNLTISQTDLVLPGNAGMELRITRTYNHQATGEKWSFSFVGVPTRVGDPTGTPTLHMGDGSERTLHNNLVTGYWITTDFWRYDASARTLYLPNGWVATYEPTGNPTGGIMLVEVEDPFGNTITPDWDDTGSIRPFKLESVTQSVSDSGATRTRTVSFLYQGNNDHLPSSMTFEEEDRTWTYAHEVSAPYRLVSAQPPEGPDWEFAYSGSGLDMTTSKESFMPGE